MNRLSVSTSRKEQSLGWFYFVFQLLILPDLLFLVSGLFGYKPTGAILNIVFFVINFLSTAIIFHRFLFKSAKAVMKAPLRLIKAVAIGYVLYWFANYLVVSLIYNLYPQYHNINDAAINTIAQDQFMLITIGTVFLVPLAEEIFFRGLMFQGLYHRNRILAYGVSAAAFSLLHLISYIGLISPVHFLVGFIQYLPAGIVFCYAYEKADSIYAPILIHMINNAIGMFAMR